MSDAPLIQLGDGWAIAPSIDALGDGRAPASDRIPG